MIIIVIITINYITFTIIIISGSVGLVDLSIARGFIYMEIK